MQIRTARKAEAENNEPVLSPQRRKPVKTNLNKFQCEFLCLKLWSKIIAGNYRRREDLEDIPDSLFAL